MCCYRRCVRQYHGSDKNVRIQRVFFSDNGVFPCIYCSTLASHTSQVRKESNIKEVTLKTGSYSILDGYGHNVCKATKMATSSVSLLECVIKQINYRPDVARCNMSLLLREKGQWVSQKSNLVISVIIICSKLTLDKKKTSLSPRQ